jgi:DNA-binding transcriptional LysR family regulator
MLAARDLPLLPVFVAIATRGSFTAAARELGLGKSVVSQHLRTLEQRCGLRLLERSTRKLRLTQAGQQVLDAAQEIMASVRSLEQVVEGQHARPTGTLRVTMLLDPILAAVVAPVAAQLMSQNPALKVDLSLDDATHDLVAEGFDIALRLGVLAESSYVVRKLGSEPEVIVASPALVEQARLDHPRRLSGCPWAVHTALPARSTWAFRSAKNDKAQVSVAVRATTNTALGLRNLLLAGAGFGVLPNHMVRQDIDDGRLLHVCPGWIHRRITLQALLPARQTPPRVRAFLSALVGTVRPLGFDAA